MLARQLAKLAKVNWLTLMWQLLQAPAWLKTWLVWLVLLLLESIKLCGECNTRKDLFISLKLKFNKVRIVHEASGESLIWTMKRTFK